MTQIKVNAGGIASLEGKVKKASSQCHSCISVMSNVRNGLDWSIQAENDIGDRITEINKRLKRQEEKLKDYNIALKNVSEEFSKTDKALKQEMKELQYRVTKSCPIEPYKKKKSWWDNILDLPETIFATNIGFLKEFEETEIAGNMLAGFYSLYKGTKAFFNKRVGEGVKNTAKGVKSLLKAKGLLKTGGKICSKGSVAGFALDIVSNIGDNYQEYKDGEIGATRAVAETITESGIDIAFGVATIALTAACPTAGILFAIGKGLLDIGFEAATGDNFTEAMSDYWLDSHGGVRIGLSLIGVRW